MHGYACHTYSLFHSAHKVFPINMPTSFGWHATIGYQVFKLQFIPFFFFTHTFIHIYIKAIYDTTVCSKCKRMQQENSCSIGHMSHSFAFQLSSPSPSPSSSSSSSFCPLCRRWCRFESLNFKENSCDIYKVLLALRCAF